MFIHLVELVTHSYNPQGLLESVTGLKPYVLSSSYDEASRLTGRVLQNNEGQNWTTAYSYYPWTDPNLGRLHTLATSGTEADATATFQNLSYSYDAVGNVLSIVDGVAGQTQSFGYDDLHRLASASAGGSEGAYGEAYEYYRGGSLQRKGDAGNANDGLYAYDDGEHVQAATSYRGNSYGYDANGNMTSRVVDDVSYTLTYDEENRLISVTGGVTVTFAYDGDGNRVRKEEDGEVTHYPNRYYESTPGSGSTKYYFADGQLVTLERSPEYGNAYGRRFVFRDHLGSTSIIVNGQGVGLWEDRYLPFGDIRYHGDTVTNTVQTRQRYTGQWLEEGLAASSENGLDRGLYLYEARWYDASLGRFIQPDTIVPEPGNPQALNRYSYTLNNPVKFTDPSGHCIVQYSGDVRMNEGPYGTSGLCPHTETPLVEGQHAIEQYHELLAAQERRNSTFERPIAEIIAGALVPEEGTASFGVAGTLGAGIYGTVSLAFIHIDADGNAVFFSPSLEAGGVAGGTAQGTVFLMFTGAENVEQLSGWYVNAGAGGGLGPAAGYEWIEFKDPESGQVFSGDVYHLGAGANVAPLPAAEIHAGAGYTLLTPWHINVFEALAVDKSN